MRFHLRPYLFMYVFQDFGVSRQYGYSVKTPLFWVFNAETLYLFQDALSGIGIAKYVDGETYLYPKVLNLSSNKMTIEGGSK